MEAMAGMFEAKTKEKQEKLASAKDDKEKQELSQEINELEQKSQSLHEKIRLFKEKMDHKQVKDSAPAAH